MIIWSSLPHRAQASWLLSLSSFKAGLCFLPLPWLSPTSPLQDSLGTWPQVEKAVGCILAHRAAWRDPDTLGCRLTFPICIMGTIILSGGVGMRIKGELG